MSAVIPFGMIEKNLPKHFAIYGHLVSDETGLTANKYKYPNLGEFTSMIEWLHSLDYQFVGIADYANGGGGKKILLTFDDGFKVLDAEIKLYLQQKKIPYMLFILTDPFSDPKFGEKLLGPKMHRSDLFLNEIEIKQLKNEGVHIGFHTRSHIRIDASRSVNEAVVREQLTIPEQFRDLLSEPLCFAYPYQAPANYTSFDDYLKQLGYKWIFDTKGFIPRKDSHFFRVSIDAENTITGKDWIKKIIKRQLMQRWLTQLRNS